MNILQNSLIRKLIGALLGTIIGSMISTVMCMVIFELGAISLFPVILLFSGGCMLTLGLSVSLTEYLITVRLSGWVRRFVSALIHIGSAVGLIWLVTEKHERFMVLICGILFSTVYWLIDEWLQLIARKS